ncbi:hypothetical protein COX24_02120 [bacterium (Candidatus Gribaldobacteria) CG23_combo_of_CG06-09_8_20_14_all_37_87_8]|uniref:Uncharacterized protein n=2 Tax=Candidatus Gribaldobacteria TaxID=2798536 RepID=A0A2G9ZEV9_9BACT|nr:MAG: hypothetical protein AUJ25_02615 [Parcubacteria group bacterium CG1_02_37_13]PIP31702.1 MAG: hypothetical protein COX24_02120 [bacterium (Candidatus Gribaldobacteria) CG23_combo_of_CG06-09_8_20_14_all_37_87_8]PIR90009.1 MAG: hypothetical protein COU05_03480 [bacterium (Candidatus Gribaldobacteria) CG10_big_fil_rev_8_21_14_0_10_37_21]
MIRELVIEEAEKRSFRKIGIGNENLYFIHKETGLVIFETEGGNQKSLAMRINYQESDYAEAEPGCCIIDETNISAWMDAVVEMKRARI